MNLAYSKAYAATSNFHHKAVAERNMQFLLSAYSDETELLKHTWKNGQAKYPAFLDDYAYLIAALIELAHKVQELPSPHPLFAFGGHAFEDHNEFIARVPGIYLDGDIISIVDQLRSLVGESASRS